MIAQQEARAQALRLSGLSGYEELPVTDALQRWSRTLEHAGHIVSAWLRSSQFAPSADEIRKLAERSDPEDDRRNWRCSECAGTGFAEVYELHTWVTRGRQTIERVSRERFEHLRHQVSGAVGEQMVVCARVRCVACALGRWRAALDAQQREEAAAKATRKAAATERPQAADRKAAAGGDA